MEKRIVIITYQFSVVVKSIEKGLSEKGFEVKLIEDDVDVISYELEITDLFIIYLPDKVIDNHDKIKNLFLICDTIKDHDRNMFLIGNDRDYDLFMKVIPGLRDFVWIPRPVEMRILLQEITKETKRIEALNAKKRILIIDDDPVYAQMVAEWLRQDYIVNTVEDGMLGISFLNKNKVDLVLLDYEMPVIDGATVLEMLQMHSETSKIPVIFLTGVRERESISRVVALKPQGYVLKTTPRDGLLKTLSDFFEKQ